MLKLFIDDEKGPALKIALHTWASNGPLLKILGKFAHKFKKFYSKFWVIVGALYLLTFFSQNTQKFLQRTEDSL